MSCHRVEHQNGSGRPPAFPRGSASTGIVHCLSGPTTPTRRSLTTTNSHCSSRRRGGLLGPCSNTGPSPRATPLYFHFSPPHGAFSHFPRGTSSLSASPMYLAFDAPTAASHCTTKQPYSNPVRSVVPGLSPAPALHSSRSTPISTHNARGLATGALPSSLAATHGIHVCFFSCPY